MAPGFLTIARPLVKPTFSLAGAKNLVTMGADFRLVKPA